MQHSYSRVHQNFLINFLLLYSRTLKSRQGVFNGSQHKYYTSNSINKKIIQLDLLQTMAELHSSFSRTLFQRKGNDNKLFDYVSVYQNDAKRARIVMESAPVKMISRNRGNRAFFSWFGHENLFGRSGGSIWCFFITISLPRRPSLGSFFVGKELEIRASACVPEAILQLSLH